MGNTEQVQVAEATRVSQILIPRIWNRGLENRHAVRKPGQNRWRATTPFKGRNLMLAPWRHRKMNATFFSTTPSLGYWHHILTQNARNRLYIVGLYARQPMIC